jgi:hypothetical protein
VYKIWENLHIFNYIAPDLTQFQVQGRPRLVTPKAREDVLDFLLKNGKLTYINEVKFYLKDEWGIKVLVIMAQRLIKNLNMTKKVISYSVLIRALLINILAHR